MNINKLRYIFSALRLNANGDWTYKVRENGQLVSRSRLWTYRDFDRKKGEWVTRNRLGEWAGLICVIAIVGVILVGTPLFIDYLSSGDNRSDLRAFEGHLDEYADGTALVYSTEEESYIVGKAVAVGIGQPHVHWQGGPTGRNVAKPYFDKGHVILGELHFELPDELRARDPEEVESIIWIEWDDDMVGRYSRSGFAARQLTGHVTIIDSARSTVTAVGSFRGGLPPKSVGGNQPNTVGSAPLRAINDFIVELPRR